MGIHYSWFAVLALVTVSLARGFLPSRYLGWTASAYWVTAVAAALLLFSSVLIHELAHSLVARARGFHVEGITLFLLGGVSSLKAEARGARDELVISLVGPLASVALAGLFWLSLYGFQDRSTPVPAVLWYLWFINLLLAGFNLLPAFPLDGGRVLRALVWAATGSFSKATAVASRGGQLFGIILIAAGVFEMMRGGLLGGLWAGIIGWFLYSAAGSGLRDVRTRASLHGILVDYVMEKDPVTVGSELTVAEVVLEHFLKMRKSAMLVSDRGQLVGIITTSDAKRVPRDRRNRLTVREGMTPTPLWCVEPDDKLADALELMTDHSRRPSSGNGGGTFGGGCSRRRTSPNISDKSEGVRHQNATGPRRRERANSHVSWTASLPCFPSYTFGEAPFPGHVA